ncbi:hypothetical protein EJ02DRAFT_432278 [Clathrospora elynae]|uniref:Uncharacterized protein n=1 Tax=Clathrospora elynae TaxID=706981 RepID=A0A6A5SXV8_9PLEO|nr:hypothetical protein EJ02DRAFT_432278 [Clathrospora elynae]
MVANTPVTTSSTDYGAPASAPASKLRPLLATLNLLHLITSLILLGASSYFLANLNNGEDSVGFTTSRGWNLMRLLVAFSVLSTLLSLVSLYLLSRLLRASRASRANASNYAVPDKVYAPPTVPATTAPSMAPSTTPSTAPYAAV